MIHLKEHTSNRTHRGSSDIVADMLNASHGGVKKTYLMYRCNLSFKQLKHYLDFMLKNGLIIAVAEVEDPNPGLFDVTDKGKKFLKAYKNLKALMK